MPKDKYWSSRPNGENPEDYRVSQWTNRQIGWEFLRRSADYQQVCRKAHDMPAGKKRVAFIAKRGRDWALATLVPYGKDWSAVSSKVEPRFFGDTYVDPTEYDEIEVSETGSIAYFGINLKVARDDSSILKLQLNDVASKAATLLATLRKREHSTATSLGRVNRKNDPALVRYLRVLDLVAAGADARHISRCVYELHGKQPLELNDIYKRLSPDRREAKRLTEGGYKKFWLEEFKKKG